MPQQNAVFQQDTDGTFTLEGQRYAAGGPYRHPEYRHPDYGEFWVGELWVLAGQSNMKGVGRFEGVEAPLDAIRSFDMNESWQRAQEPLHHHIDSPREVYTRDMPRLSRAERPDGAGLGLSFAKARHAQTGVPVGLIPCARGNTSLAEWSPAGRDPQRDLYGAMLDRIRLCGGKVAGVLWYQGESDAMNGDWPQYSSRMDDLLTALRRDLGQPDLPFLMVQLGRYATTPTPELTQGWNEVREQQRQWAAAQAGVSIVTAADLTLTDPIHLNTAALQRLGRRLAQASLGADGLTPGELSWTAPGILRLNITGVQGKLQAPPRPLGFSLRDTSGQNLHLIFATEVRGETVHLHLQEPVPEGAKLWYGYGLDPTCNLTDQTGQALLTFGPLELPPS